MSIKEYLPKSQDNLILMQVRIDKELHTKLKNKMKTLKCSGREFVEASIKAFLKEG